MKFFLQDDISEQVDRIIRSLNKIMDGDVSEQMEGKGLSYKLNYGASILWLRQMAKKYAPNNRLAERLWSREIRETMVLATLIAEFKEDFLVTMEDWMNSIPTPEIAEQLGANLVWKHPDLYTFAINNINSNSRNKQAVIWVALSAYLQKGFKMEEEQYGELLVLLEKTINDNNKFDLRVKGRFLRQLCRVSRMQMGNVEGLMDKFKGNDSVSWLREDVLTEIAFLKDS
ncbi:DNA alkylation repair protein [Plebeiibacterium marinum]|uniref:DNA alkylation repair protein n=1 Tax=Plebeiibacterium marinum TaxID=2992111 RepID=A0AAE3SJD9_9BACT|nr:DNA alkylation repair protein [Plebeiobacterium marinum]MCW3805298.1 DNA alkylation repair protein [Plebeiobacterium marinum]